MDHREKLILGDLARSVTICLERTINLGNYSSMKVGLHGTYEYESAAGTAGIGQDAQFSLFQEDLESKFKTLLRDEAQKFSVNNVNKIMNDRKEGEFE